MPGLQPKRWWAAALVVLFLGTGCHWSTGGDGDAVLEENPPAENPPAEDPPPEEPPEEPPAEDGDEGLRIVRVFTNENVGDGLRRLYVATRAGRIGRIGWQLDPAATVVSFSVAPTGDQVAFEVEGGAAPGLYVSPLSRSDPVRVTDPADEGVDVFVWSPDGARLVYRTRRSGAMRAFVVDADGGGRIDVAGTGGTMVSPPRWAGPDRLLYTSDKFVAGHRELYSVRADGTGETRLTGTAAAAGEARFVSYSISPDGEQVAFRSDPDTSGVFDLYVADVDGGGSPVRLTDGTGGLHTNEAIWAPDGANLLFLKAVPAGLPEVWLTSADGGDARKVSGDLAGPPIGLAWSPDGQRFAYREGSTALHVGGLSGVAEERTRTGSVVDFAFSPSGEWLAWREAPAHGDPLVLMLAPASGSAVPESLLPPGGSAGPFAFVPAPPSEETAVHLDPPSRSIAATYHSSVFTEYYAVAVRDARAATSTSMTLTYGSARTVDVPSPPRSGEAPLVSVVVDADGIEWVIDADHELTSRPIPTLLGRSVESRPVPRDRVFWSPEEAYGMSMPVVIRHVGQGAAAGVDFDRVGVMLFSPDGRVRTWQIAPGFPTTQIQTHAGEFTLQPVVAGSVAGQDGDQYDFQITPAFDALLKGGADFGAFLSSGAFQGTYGDGTGKTWITTWVPAPTGEVLVENEFTEFDEPLKEALDGWRLLEVDPVWSEEALWDVEW